jgi:Protein of unknown function (DUF2997)
MPKKIQLRIFPDGRVQAEVQGIKGKVCTNYIEILEEILNAEVYKSSRTLEYYESQDVLLEQQIDQSIQGGK